MAHAVETMFSGSKQTPWHGLGKQLDGTVTSARALKESGLDWGVRLEPVQITNGEWRRDTESVPAVAIVRDSDARVLGASGIGYRPVQNATLFAVGDTLKDAGACWETAGSLYGGRRVWALMRTDIDAGAAFVADGDQMRSYLLLANAHDGLRCAEVLLTTVRVVCANTYRLATLGAGSGLLRFRHTANVELLVQQAAELLMKAKDRYAEFLEVARELNKHPMKKDAQVRLLADALSIKLGTDMKVDGTRAAKKLDVAIACLEAERAAAADPDSAWIAFNGVTRFTTHQARVLGTAQQQAEKRLDNTIWGPTAAINDRAFELATAAAGI